MSSLWPTSSKVDPQTFYEAYGYYADQLDDCPDWKTHQPLSEWTPEDEVKWQAYVAQTVTYMAANREAMMFIWELEGVRCGTFGRDPHRNPYEDHVKEAQAARRPMQ